MRPSNRQNVQTASDKGIAPDDCGDSSCEVLRARSLFHHKAVYRRGQVVIRETGPWAATVHLLLRHLEDVGFAGAPRVVGSGFDAEGRETLSFIDVEIIESVRQRWLKGDPMTVLSTYSQSLEGLKGVYIDVGDEDLLGPFHEELTRLGIEHEYNVYHGDHYANPVERFIGALEFLSARLPEPIIPSTIRSNDSLPGER